MADTAHLIVALGLQDNLSSGLGRAASQLNKLEASSARLGRGFGQVGQGLDRIITRGAIAAASGLGTVLKLAGDFQAQLNTIGTIAVTTGQSTQAGLGNIGEGILALSRQTGASLDDLTHSYYDLLSAGVKVSDAQTVLTVANKLSVGAIGTNSEAVDVLTTALNSYNLTGADAARVSDQIAEAVAAGKTTLSEIAPVYAQVAPLAAQFGIGTDEVAAAIGRLTQLGNPVAEVTTQMSRAILELVKPRGAMKNLQDALGVNFSDEVRKKGLVATLQEIRVEADKLGPHVFQELFNRIEGFRFAVQVTGGSNKAFVDELARVRAAAGLTAAQFSERQQGLNFQLGVLKANAISAGISIGNELIPSVVSLAQEFSAFLSKPSTQAGIKQFATDLAKGVKGLIAELKGADFSGLIGGMKIAAEVAKTAFDLFNRLPPEVRALAVGALAVNKLSGGGLGLVVKGLGNIVGGAVGMTGGLFGRGSSPTNPLWVASTTSGVGGGPGGGLSIGRLLGLTSAGALGAILGNEIGHAVFFDPTVKPAVEFEQRQFNDLLQSNDPVLLRRSLGELQQSLSYLRGNDPLQQLVSGLLTGDQIALLQEQVRLLQQVVNALPAPSAPERTGSRVPGIVGNYFNPLRGKADLQDPFINGLIAGHMLPSTALGPDVVNPLLLPFDEQTRLLREIRDKPSKPLPINITINTPVYVNASLLQAKIYQISTSARLREG